MEKICFVSLIIIVHFFFGCHSHKTTVDESRAVITTRSELADTAVKVSATDWLQNFTGTLKDFELTIVNYPKDTSNIISNQSSLHQNSNCSTLSSLRPSAPQVSVWHLKGAELAVKKQDSISEQITETREIQRKQDSIQNIEQKQEQDKQNTLGYKPPNMTIVLIVIALIVMLTCVIKKFFIK